MARNFSLDGIRSEAARGGPRFWLILIGLALFIANVVALWFYLAPPGGSQADLLQQRDQLNSEIASTRASSTRLKRVSGKVQTGSGQAEQFESRYFLPEREAYSAVMSELQAISKKAGLDEREAQFSKEPIEGSDDLTVLNIAVRFQGSYANLMKFLHEVDTSPMLLMLDTLQATPQQRTGQIESEIRFQVIIHEEQALQAGVIE
jgi:Tfp pilus assembly protein PilO